MVWQIVVVDLDVFVSWLIERVLLFIVAKDSFIVVDSVVVIVTIFIIVPYFLISIFFKVEVIVDRLEFLFFKLVIRQIKLFFFWSFVWIVVSLSFGRELKEIGIVMVSRGMMWICFRIVRVVVLIFSIGVLFPWMSFHEIFDVVSVIFFHFLWVPFGLDFIVVRKKRLVFEVVVLVWIWIFLKILVFIGVVFLLFIFWVVWILKLVIVFLVVLVRIRQIICRKIFVVWLILIIVVFFWDLVSSFLFLFRLLLDIEGMFIMLTINFLFFYFIKRVWKDLEIVLIFSFFLVIVRKVILVIIFEVPTRIVIVMDIFCILVDWDYI